MMTHRYAGMSGEYATSRVSPVEGRCGVMQYAYREMLSRT